MTPSLAAGNIAHDKVISPGLLIRIVATLILLSAYANTVLRLNHENPITLYRILLPIAILSIWLLDKNIYWRFLFFTSLLTLYGFLACVFSSYSLSSENLILSIDYATICITCSLTIALQKRFGHQWIWKHICYVFYLMIVLSYIQLFTGIGYPNTQDRGFGAINIFFWNENDLSLALGMGIIGIIFSQKTTWLNILGSIGGIYIIFYNDSKVALISLLIIFIARIVAPIMTARRILIGTTLICIFFALMFFGPDWWDIDLGFRDHTTLKFLIMTPLTHIFTLTPYPQFFGSIAERANASIFGIQELLRTWARGIGPANSYAMLAQPEHAMQSLKSLHNFALQLLLEYGYFFILSATLFLYWLKNNQEIHRNKYIFIILFVGILLISLSQSAGIISNHYFFVVLTYLFTSFKHHTRFRGNFDQPAKQPKEVCSGF